MWAFFKGVFALIGGFFKFLGELLGFINSGLEELNKNLEELNKELETERLKRQVDIDKKVEKARRLHQERKISQREL